VKGLQTRSIPYFYLDIPSHFFMGFKDTVPAFLLVLLSILIALLIGLIFQSAGGHWAAIIALAVLFFLLFLSARWKGWTAPFRIRVIGSSLLSELFLSLTLITAGLAFSWYLGVAISKAYTAVEGVLASLCIFGILMLVVSSSRNWQ
jgi:hypothetical protein